MLSTGNLLEIETWCKISFVVWLCYASAIGWTNLKPWAPRRVWDLVGFLVGLMSTVVVVYYVRSN